MLSLLALTPLGCAPDPILCIDGSILGPSGCPGGDTGEAPTAEPLLTAEEVGPALAALLDQGIPEALTPGLVYKELIDHTDDDCPGQEGGQFALLEPCTTEEGYVFSGVSSFGWDCQEGGESGYCVFGSLQTSIEAASPDGDTLSMGGIFQFGSSWIIDSYEASSRMEVTAHYPPSPTWLATETSTSMSIALLVEEEAVLTLEGGFTIGDQSAHFDALTGTSDCPMGGVRLRDEAGAWYAVRLQDCSGCGPVSSQGVELGEACLELGPALSALATVMQVNP